MSSVSELVETIEQPAFGILPISYFEKKELKQDSYVLSNKSSIPAIHLGLIVDYCIKYILGVKLSDILHVEYAGYAEHIRVSAVKFFDSVSEQSLTQVYIEDERKNICLSDFIYKVENAETFEEFVTNMLYVIQYGDFVRNIGYAYNRIGEVFDTELSKEELQDILIFFIRTQGWINTFEKATPMYKFKPFGYNNTVTSGEGDFCTKYTLWDLKVSNGEPTTKDTLQLLIYYIMAKKSGNSLYKDVNSIGVYNPKLDATWICNIEKIDPSIVNKVKGTLGFK